MSKVETLGSHPTTIMLGSSIHPSPSPQGRWQRPSPSCRIGDVHSPTSLGAAGRPHPFLHLIYNPPILPLLPFLSLRASSISRFTPFVSTVFPTTDCYQDSSQHDFHRSYRQRRHRPLRACGPRDSRHPPDRRQGLHGRHTPLRLRL